MFIYLWTSFILLLTQFVDLSSIMLGAKSAVAVDTDEWAINNAIENQRRGVSDAAELAVRFLTGLGFRPVATVTR